MEELPVEILQQVCELVSTAPAVTVNSDGVAGNPIDGLSKTNKLFRELCFPSLFRKIIIDGPWDHASEHSDEDNKFFPDPLDEFIDRLLDLLASLNGLQELEFFLPNWFSPKFAHAFDCAKVILPKVQTLGTAPACSSIIRLFPNVKRIEQICMPRFGHLELQRETIRLASEHATKLEHYHHGGGHSMLVIDHLVRLLPNLKDVSFDDYHLCADGRTKLPLLASTLSRLKNLRTIRLPGLAALGLGNGPYNPPDVKEKEEFVSKIMFERCKGVTELGIGPKKMTAVRDEGEAGRVVKIVEEPDGWDWHVGGFMLTLDD
ncbi:MAG: hypothetical protein Q9190_002361 [Brigantiaea leucoxantha]